MTADASYARARELQERAAADAAADPSARDAHFVMAERYADQVFSIEEGFGAKP